LELLNNLILKLSSHEKSLVRNYLAHLNVKKKGERKALELFDLIVKKAHRDPGSDQYALLVYGRKADGKFRMLKSKLRAYILDSLVLEKSIDLNKTMDPVILSELKLEKRISTMKFLFHSRGPSPMVMNIIQEVLTKGKKYENYGPMLEALKLKKYLRSFIKGISEFEEINKEILFVEYCGQAVAKANDYYYRLITRTDFNANRNKESIEKYSLEAIEELSRDFKYTRAGQVGYYLKQMEVAYFHGRGDYLTARNAGVELLEIIREFPSVYRKSRIGIAFDIIGECDIFLKEYERAISNFTAAQNIFLPGSTNFMVSKELLLRTYFYSNTTALAEKILKEISEHPSASNLGDFRASKYPYYLANIHFKKGRYKEALKEINQQLEIAQDKTGWGIHQRVLGIMCNIELGRLDQATLQVDALVRQVDRMKGSAGEGQELGERDARIVRFLVALSKKGFMYNSVNEKNVETLLQLENEFPWQPLTPEMMPFHEWMGAKVPGYVKKMKEKENAVSKAAAEKKVIKREKEQKKN
jgi:tetratricopeptide (TPR) repeat protein